VVIEKDVLKGILKQSRDADLLLMAGRTGDFLELLFAKTVSQEITEQVKCPVLWVKEYQEPKSLWRTLLKPYGKGEG
jgi:nucleotide-binding universal stress UspA family protein